MKTPACFSVTWGLSASWPHSAAQQVSVIGAETGLSVLNAAEGLL